MLFTELAFMLANQNGLQIAHQKSQAKQSFWQKLFNPQDRLYKPSPASAN